MGHLKDISFFEDLHRYTLRVAFYRGTNNTENVRQKMITKPSETVSSMYYMTTADKAWEVNVDSEYRFYKNLSLFLELGYIRMDLDSNVWKDYESKKNNFEGAVCVLSLPSGLPVIPTAPAALPPPEPSLCPKSRPTRVNHTFYTRKETA